jgi:putative colanic acid biosynthesis UDP-glucose lipid carrier transferase
MIVNQKSLYSIKLWLDLFLLILSFILAALIAQPAHILYQRPYMFLLMVGLNFLWYFTTNITEFYDILSSYSFSNQFVSILKNATIQIISSVLFIFLVKEDLFTRNFIVLYFIFINLFIGLRIVIYKQIQKAIHTKGKYTRNLVIIGSNNIGAEFSNIIESNLDFGYKLIGFVDDSYGDSKNYLGNIENLNNIITTQNIDEVVIAIPNYDLQKLKNIINVCNKNAVRIHIIPDYYQFLSKKFTINIIGNFHIITVRNEPLSEIQWRFIKRSFDLIFTIAISFLFLIWLIPLIALIVKLTSPGPIFFIQDRVGLKNKKFKCYKFRSMHKSNHSNDTDFAPTVENDPRVTALGRFLRSSNLDELPQFLNILKGDMSIVGPRPHAVTFNIAYVQYFDNIKLRHLVKPGLTGWAQVHGLRGDVADHDENRKKTIKRIEYDIWYIENWSLGLDLQIILLTTWQMLTRNTKGY